VVADRLIARRDACVFRNAHRARRKSVFEYTQPVLREAGILTEGSSFLILLILRGADMANKLAVVTGASSGIGLSLAKELAGRGYDLIVASAGERLGPAAEELRGTGVDVVDVQADLSTREGVDELWERVEASGRNLDIACINARIGVGGLFDETDLDTELKMVALNCASTVHLAKHVVRQMKQRGEGKILFTASIAGEMVAPREAVYAATKAFDLSLAHSLRYELRDSGVTVTALQPGPTDTDFFHRAGMDNTQVGSEGKSESQPEDVARQGIEALLAGKDHVYAASMKTKTEGMLASAIPGSVKAAMHEKMAKPLDEKKAS
jgi:short-subunit dehydrogenase